jgi:hypothetical protein
MPSCCFSAGGVFRGGLVCMPSAPFGDLLGGSRQTVGDRLSLCLDPETSTIPLDGKERPPLTPALSALSPEYPGEGVVFLRPVLPVTTVAPPRSSGARELFLGRSKV